MKILFLFCAILTISMRAGHGDYPRKRLTKGKIQIHFEAAEIFYKTMRIRPIKS